MADNLVVLSPADVDRVFQLVAGVLIRNPKMDLPNAFHAAVAEYTTFMDSLRKGYALQTGAFFHNGHVNYKINDDGTLTIENVAATKTY